VTGTLFPLLKDIKYENRFSYVLSTKNGFNQIVAEYADTHEYIEDIFHLTEISAPEVTQEELEVTFDPEMITDADTEKAREVARYLYGSQIWKRASQLGCDSISFFLDSSFQGLIILPFSFQTKFDPFLPFLCPFLMLKR
jgi:hypothetical protein